MIMYLFDLRDILAGGTVWFPNANNCETVVTVNFMCQNSA